MIVVYVFDFDLRPQGLRSRRQPAQNQTSGSYGRQSDSLHNRSKS
jgi:hypothetical protein